MRQEKNEEEDSAVLKITSMHQYKDSKQRKTNYRDQKKHWLNNDQQNNK